MKKQLLIASLFTLSMPLYGMDKGCLEKADRYFEATLFDQAEALYLEALHLEPRPSPHEAYIKRQLAKSYYIKKRYQEIVALFSDAGSESFMEDDSDSSLECLFLLGKSLNKLQQYERAISPLEHFLKMKKRAQEVYADDAKFELGLAFFQQKQMMKAKAAFNKIPLKGNQPKLYALGQLYLARIAVFEEDSSAAEQHMRQLEGLQVGFSPFAAEYIRGELHYRKNEWEHASSAFENAIPPQDFEPFQWHADALYYLGWCYLNMGKSSGNLRYLEQAAARFDELESMQPSERTRLSLSQALLASHLIAPNDKIVEKLNRLLGPEVQWKKRDHKHEALFILAESASDFTERKKLHRQLVHDSFSDSPLYSKSWYVKGLSELEEGEKLNQNPQTKKEAGKLFEHAIVSLGKSFDSLYSEHPKIAVNALKQQIYAHYYLQTKEGLLRSLSIISQLLNQYRENLFPLLSNPDEIYFLQGLVASQLLDCEEKRTFFSIAENSLNHCIESYPKGPYLPRALHLLGTLHLQEGNYAQAERAFLKLAHLTPPTNLNGEAWYWAAETAEKSGQEKQVVQQRRKRAYEQIPLSPLADAAYFRYYSYSDYLNGNPNAVQHLNELEIRFPHSPYLMIAKYLLGLEAISERKTPNGKIKKPSDPHLAVELFNASASLFSELPIPEQNAAYFSMVRFRSLIEQSFALKSQGKDEASIELLRNIYEECRNCEHSKIEEETALLLVQGYLDQANNNAASSILAEILEKYHLSKTTRGYYLSRAWYQRGILAMKQEDPLFAEQCFQRAEDAAKGKILSTDELLDLWIQQSISFQEQGKTDEAMLILSKVINYDAVSAERLRAMYLRANIYESQGRKDLARRQLQATASKGGPWSLKAKEKLDKYYGYQ